MKFKDLERQYCQPVRSTRPCCMLDNILIISPWSSQSDLLKLLSRQLVPFPLTGAKRLGKQGRSTDNNHLCRVTLMQSCYIISVELGG